MEGKFIYCKDEELSKKLLKNYRLISKSQDIYIFENTPTNNNFDFSNIDKTKIAFGDKLFF